MVNARRLGSAALAAWLGSLACDTDLDPGLEGLACRAQLPQCLPGYVCSADNRCLRGDAGSGGGGSGGSSGEGNAGTAAGSAGVAGDGASPAGGAAGAGPDGSGGFRYDAGPGLDDLDASVLPDAAGCDVAVPLFRDEDEDGFGITSQQVFGCPPLLRWALEGGDCRDDQASVHPRQLEFFATGYADPTRPEAGNVSFDYDCTVTEEAAPNTAPAPACNEALTCEGTGYVPVSPARLGPGVNGICGSTQLVVCQSTAVPLLGLTCAAVPVDSATPARCR